MLLENPAQGWQDDIDEDRWAALVYRMGNLTPLEAPLNRDAGSAPYAEKRTRLAASRYTLKQDVVTDAPETWDRRTNRVTPAQPGKVRGGGVAGGLRGAGEALRRAAVDRTRQSSPEVSGPAEKDRADNGISELQSQHRRQPDPGHTRDVTRFHPRVWKPETAALCDDIGPQRASRRRALHIARHHVAWRLDVPSG